MDNSFGNRLQYLRKKLNMGQKEFGASVGVNHSVTVSRWENDKQKPELYILTALANLYDVNLGWLITGNGEAFNKKKSFQTDMQERYETCTHQALYYDNLQALVNAPQGNRGYYTADPSIIAEISLPAAVKIAGDSMEPTVKNEDVVLADISPRRSRPEADGIYALNMGSTAIIRRYAGYKAQRMEFTADNRIYPPYILEEADAEMKIIGRIKAVISRKI